MTLTIKQIEERVDMNYRKFRNSRVNRNDALVAKEMLDLLMDDLKYFNEKLGKKVKEELPEDDNTSNQIKVIKSLRMNNPLWDVE